MKNAITMALAVLTLCTTLGACGSNMRTNARTRYAADEYRGNVSTGRDGTVNGTNDYFDTDLELDW